MVSPVEALPELDFEDVPLVGVVSTLYRDAGEVRYKLALQTAEAYRDLGIPLVVVDASPESEFGDSLRERAATVINAPRPGLATQYMDGVAYAVSNGAERIVRHEPEKTGMVNFARQISEALKIYDIVVIGRTERAMRSLPSTQARTERLAGWLLEKELGMPADALSGGRGYTRRGAEYLVRYDTERYGNKWLDLYYPVLAAMKDGLPVGGLELDLIHPPEMVAEEEGNPAYDTKRYEQFMLQMESLLAEVGYNLSS